jgi:hypothetical protein
LLILGGISGAGMTTFIEAYRPLFLLLTFGLLGVAFYVTYRPRRSRSGGGSRMMAFNKIMLWGVTAFVVVLLFFPQAVMGLFPSSDSEVPADMQQTIIRIEGMT